MATNAPKISDTVTAAGDAVLDVTKTVQDAAEAQADTTVKAATKAIEATAPVATKSDSVTAPVVAAAKAPVKAAKRAARTVKAKAAPVRKAVVKAVAPVTPAPIKKAAKAVVTAAAKVATPASKEWNIMATKFETPKLFTDLNDRAKTAVDKGQKFAAEFGDFNKGNIEAMVESSKIAAKGLESMGQDAAEYTRKSFEGMTATLKSLASVKSPTDFFKLQSDYARSAFDAAVAQTTKNTEAMVKLASEAAQPISSRFAVAVEKVKQAA
ncbi:MAG: phasin family protein [Pseudomonadota bacterium]